ncbi:putative Zn(II)2Cys6 transcription factor [Amylocarpus encephaloides]|uniref:Zn(II)2Cys6 transcription factor n=1 Tax=Amylocarpus encephaloides TaxID=45428 RepID=A0A9P7YEV0_9HELO|nr:putative Zn(II)2Cys6 transcription factor [Amylocarpus encephaloides]
MSESQTRKAPRKGTTSCIECRRRKVRCIRVPDDAEICRRCEERSTACVAQLYSTQSLQKNRFSSRQRIAELEAKVDNLNNVVRNIELKLGYQPSPVFERTIAPPPPSGHGSELSDDNSSILDVLDTEGPSQLHSLFQNDWLSVDTTQQAKQDRNARTTATLLDGARAVLQKLIPAKDDILEIPRYASRWLGLISTLLPQPFSLTTHEEMLQGYDEMHSAEVDVIRLASWLLIVSITAQQLPREYGSQASMLNGNQRFSDFPKAVVNAIESTLMSQDRLICTDQGLGMALQFFRLQMSQGNFQKAWLRLRHFIAIAELMGLPKGYQVVQSNIENGVENDEAQSRRAQLWESLCACDGLAGMAINLPPSISPYKRPKAQKLIVDGHVQPQSYISRLMDVTTAIQYDIHITPGSSGDIYASVLDLDRRIRMLASEMPYSWWSMDKRDINADSVVQFMHYCTTMRVHLSFAARPDPDGQYSYSRFACRDACESVAKYYQFLRRDLPSGIFISQNMDLQVFTASVALLLLTHGSPSTKLQIDKGKIDKLISEVVTLMEEKSRDNVAGSNLAQHGVSTIRSLYGLLRQEDQVSEVQQLTLKIPLLGRVHISRNHDARVAPPNNTEPIQTPANAGWQNNGQLASQEQGHLLLPSGNQFGSSLQTPNGWHFDPLSWSIEDQCDDFFQGSFNTQFQMDYETSNGF